jgi:HK97 family phage major capsid protein
MLANAVISNVEQYGVARRYARLWTMDSASLSVPTNLEGLTIAAVGEKDPTPTSDLSTGAVSLVAKEFAGGVRISRSLLDDSPVAIADFCVGEFSRAVAKMEDSAVFIADGTSPYAGTTGILWRAENVAAVAGAKFQAASGHDTFAEIDLTDLTATMAKLPGCDLHQAGGRGGREQRADDSGRRRGSIPRLPDRDEPDLSFGHGGHVQRQADPCVRGSEALHRLR